MGVVFRAHDPEIDRPVAIKLVRADLLNGADREDYLVRFRREAQIAGRCTHPNIVAIYDFAMHEGNPFLAMEFVDGISLSQARERGMLFGVGDSLAVMRQVLGALEAAHSMGIIHRDIKPANILLHNGTRVKVTDFGVSRFENLDLTQEGAVIGTPNYMSPEQLRGEAVDARSDLFSAGVVLFELLCGERPFPGRNYAEVSRRVLHEPPPDLTMLSVSVTPALNAVLQRALAKSPEARFATAAAMRAALEDHETPGETIVSPPPAPRGAPSFSPTSIDAVERTLARYVGPVAPTLMRSAIFKAGTAAELCALLGESIEASGDRARFRAEALGQLQAASPTEGGLSAQELERAQLALTRFLGPIARVLVKRAASDCSSRRELWRRLSLHIDHDDERRAFLAGEGR